MKSSYPEREIHRLGSERRTKQLAVCAAYGFNITITFPGSGLSLFFGDLWPMKTDFSVRIISAGMLLASLSASASCSAAVLAACSPARAAEIS